MKIIIMILMTFIPHSYARVINSVTIRVAVIDTGINLNYIGSANLCSNGHKSFVRGEGLLDANGHGTNILGLINRFARDANYCVILIKFYGKNNVDTKRALINSIKYAYSLRPDIINISAGGNDPIPEERTIIKKILDGNIILNVAAGNTGSDLNKKCNYYPACYDARLNVISAKDVNSANRGRIVDKYIPGKRQKAFGLTLSGTSQSTAKFTGMMIYKRSKK